MRNIKDLKEEDFLSGKVNLHIHTNFSDGKADFESVIKNAKAKGYELIAITDHNTVEGHKKFQDDILVTGAEFDCWFGYVFIHLLAYNIDINHPALVSFLAKNKAETIAVLAHPACYWAISLENLVKNLMKVGLDGIEVYYPYPRFRKIVKFHSSKDVIKIANKYPQLIKTGGTDFHGEEF